MSIKLALLTATLIALLALSGCKTETASTFTNVHSDGSFQRTITYKTNAPPQSEVAARTNAEKREAQRHNRADDIVLPKPMEWKNARTHDEDNDILVSTRAVRSGVTLYDDMGLKQDDPTGKKHYTKPLVGNHVTVWRNADGNLEYQEVLHWNGKQFPELTRGDSGAAAILKPYLPATIRNNHAVIEAIALDVQTRVWESLFSPPRPLLPELLTTPDYGSYAIARQIRPLVAAALSERCGSAVAAIAAGPIAERLSKYCLYQLEEKKASTSPTPIAGWDVDALFYRVKLPGKVIASNGEIDPDSNEVVWSLYTVAACPKDVILTATCEDHP